MKLIQLNNRKPRKTTTVAYAMVDDEDFEWLNQWSWQSAKGRNTFYVRGRINGEMTSMHRTIMKLSKGDPLFVDHIDLNGLNNQRENLRIVTHSQNARNRRAWGKSSYLGVSYQHPWTAGISVDGRTIKLGRFATEIEAAQAYNEAAIKYHGEFARLNQISPL